MNTPTDPLDRLAEAIVDGRSVDWGGELSSAPGDRACVDEIGNLRDVDEIGRLHRRHRSAGTLLGDFELLREIGSGGMGIVYEARQRSLGRSVALKLLPRELELNPQAVRRFEHEARAAARLQHRNIVAVHTIGTHDGHRFYSMDLVRGPSLDQVLAQLRRGVVSGFVRQALTLSPAAAVGVSDATVEPPALVGCDWCRPVVRRLAEVAGALEYVHAHGIVHRDIKPANLLMHRSGELRVTDFGLACFMSDESMSESSRAVGTPAYMAPEQISRTQPIDHRADIFSLGAVLYETLTLARPFTGTTTTGLLDQILNRDPLPLRKRHAAVSESLEQICLRALQKQPDDRYASAGEMKVALLRSLDGMRLSGRRGAGIFARAWSAVRRAVRRGRSATRP